MSSIDDSIDSFVRKAGKIALLFFAAVAIGVGLPIANQLSIRHFGWGLPHAIVQGSALGLSLGLMFRLFAKKKSNSSDRAE